MTSLYVTVVYLNLFDFGKLVDNVKIYASLCVVVASLLAGNDVRRMRFECQEDFGKSGMCTLDST